MTAEQKQALLSSIKKATFEIGSKPIIAVGKKPIVRDAMPTDYGYPLDKFLTPPLVADTWTTIATFTTPDKVALGIGGLVDVDPTPRATALRITIGGVPKRLIVFQEMFARLEKEKIFEADDQIVIPEATDVKLELFAHSPGPEMFGLIGYVCEAAGRKIDKRVEGLL